MNIEAVWKHVFWFSTLSRYALPVDSQYFEGTGYGKLIIDKTAKYLRIDMSVLARSENGLLFYIGNDVSYSLYGYCLSLYAFEFEL